MAVVYCLKSGMPLYYSVCYPTYVNQLLITWLRVFIIFRELCLAALGAHTDAVSGCPKPVSCLDAFTATGVIYCSFPTLCFK